MAPYFELSTTVMACVESTLKAQPAIVPCSVAKINALAALVLPFDTTKPVEALNTMPVGAPGSALVIGPGICTIRGTALPLPSYNVDVPLWLLATQTAPVGLNAMPHVLTRFAS